MKAVPRVVAGVGLAALAATNAAQSASGAQHYPSRPIRVIGANTAGSATDMGREPQPTSPEGLLAHLRAETERWSQVIKLAGPKRLER